jgi:quercetin dioxygenase-like cupin family protein
MITKLKTIKRKELPNVSLRYIKPSKENVVVYIKPNHNIPLHTHEVNATMYIISGDGFVLSEDKYNNRKVNSGDCVFFAKNKSHGFRAGKDGLVFLSCNGGILKKSGMLDLVFNKR